MEKIKSALHVPGHGVPPNSIGARSWIVLLACVLTTGLPSPALAATFTVDSTADIADASPGDGICATAGGACTLRAGIQEANSLADPDTINLPAGTYILSLNGPSEDVSASGDLDVTQDLTILGSGARTTTIDGAGLDRVFQILGTSTLDISGVTIRNGRSPITTNGGGIAAGTGTLLLTDVTVTENASGNSGGGISVSSGTAILTNVTLSNNLADSHGGGIFIGVGTASLTNVTISGNTAGANGGGVSAQSATVTLANVTITDNRGSSVGGVFNSASSTVIIRNTIIANSLSGGNCQLPLNSLGNNLDSGNTCGLAGPGDLVNTNPLLGPLQNNGGPTDTHPLLPGSPALDGGTNTGCPGTDQRGVIRPVDGDSNATAICDIGALEYNSPPGSADLSLTKTVDNPFPAFGGAVTFTLTVSNAGPANATGVAVTDLLPSGYTYVSDSGGGAYDSGTGLWTVGEVPATGFVAHTLTATVNTTGSYGNTAEITAASEPDPDSTPGNGAGNGEDDQASRSTIPGVTVADLSLGKTVNNAAPGIGSNVTFTVTVDNAGPGNATGVVVIDLLPSGYTYVSDSGGGSYVPGTGVWTVGGVPASGSVSHTITATVNASGPYVNSAEIAAAGEPDPDSTPGNGIGNGEDDQTSRGTTPAFLNLVLLSKSATNREVSVGGLADFLVTAENTSGGAVAAVTVNDEAPAGFALASGSVRIVRSGPDSQLGTADDVIAALPGNGTRPALLGPFDLAAAERVEIRYVLRVGSGVLPGEHTNRATPMQGSVPIGNTARATVEVLLDPAFDLSVIIGKVFEDADRDGTQDPGEPGMPGVMVALDDGTYAITDDYGRLHFPAVKPGQRMVKINRHSLPPGSTLTTDGSRILWITPGLLAKADFGVVPRTETESIGTPALPGLAVVSTPEERPTEVVGSVEALTAIVNGLALQFPTTDVQIGLEDVDDIIRLEGAELKQPVIFDLVLDPPEATRCWTLTIMNSDGTPFRVFKGEGTSQESVSWDGRSDDGRIVQAGGIYQYQLEATFADGSQTASARGVFGVNQSRAFSLQLSGDAFETGKANLSDRAKTALEKAAAVLRQFPDEKVLVEGHTDSVGSSEFNLALSQRRTEAAAAYLADPLELDPARIVTTWYGERRPIASNADAAGRALNRRIEIRAQGEKVIRAQVRDHFRAEPSVVINGEPATVKRDGRFSTYVTTEGTDDLTITMSDDEGRSVRAAVPLPLLEIAAPRGRQVLAFGTANDVCRAGRPGEDGRWSGAEPAAVCRFLASTRPGSQVELNGAPLEVAPDGTFASELSLSMGDNVFGLVVRDPDGHTRIADLDIQVSDRDDQGLVLTAQEAIPHLSVNLPPAGIRLTSRQLALSGRTDPGNRVDVNGRPLEVRPDGGFAGSVELPQGESTLVIRVTDRQKRTGQIQRKIQVAPTQLFLLAFADGSFGRIHGDGFIEAAGLDRADSYYSEGRAAFYLKGVIAGRYLTTAAFDSGHQGQTLFGDLDGERTRRLLTNLDPDKFYQVYGDDGAVVYDAQRQGKFYLALEGDALQALFGNYPLSLNDTELAAYQRTMHGGRFVYRSLSRTQYGEPDTQVVLFAADAPRQHVRDELRATGGSLYYMSHSNVVEGSEEVTVVVRDKNTGLVLSRERQRQNFDFTIKYEEGRLLFLRPIASVAASGSLVNQELLSGHPVFVQIDYDSIVSEFEKTASGARVRRQMGDHVAVGGTYVDDRLGAGAYELKAADAEVRLGRASKITTEYAESQGVDAFTFVSEDGGVSYTSVAATGFEQGAAWKSAVVLDVGEWFGRPDRYRVSAYVKQIDPGFFSNGNRAEQGTDKIGLHASLKISGRDIVHVRQDHEDRKSPMAPGVAGEATVTSLQWDRTLKRWGFGVEFLDNETSDGAGGLLKDSRLGAARFWSRLSEKLTARLERQQTLGGPDTDQTSVDLDYHVLRSLSLTARGTDGSRGNSAQAGAVLKIGENEVYATERLADDQAGNRTSTVFGARAPLGRGSKVYTEYQWEDREGESQRVSVLGLQWRWEAGPGFKVLLSGETADVIGSSLVSKRSAGTASLSYSNGRALTAVTQGQLRFEDGTARREQVLSLNQVDVRLNPDWTLLGKYRYSATRDRDTDTVEARLEEQGIGFAYRPVRHDRFNALTRFSRVLDMRPPSGAEIETSERVLEVASFETVFAVTPRVEWISKLASRMQKETFGDVASAKSNALLVIQRLNLTIWRPVEWGLEYRVLGERGGDNRRQGWLTELMLRLHEHFRLGGGFNFTDFTDNEFSRNDYSVRGWFIRAQGRY